MKKILVPSDFSNTAHFAHEYAKAIARELSSEIYAVHAYSIPYLESTIPSEIRLEIEKQEIKNAEKRFREFFSNHPNQKPKEEVAVRVRERYTISEGLPSEVIMKESNSDDIGLIVMGTKGSHNIGEKIFGSVTTSVIKRAKVPVLVVPEGASFKGIKNIAYATNYEKGDDVFVEYLEHFSKTMNATTHFVHIDDSKKGYLKPGESEPETKVHFDMGFVSFTEIAGDSIVQSIDHFIDNEKIDLLALFIPNRNFWDRMFHISLTNKMVFHSKIPMLFWHG